MDELLRFRVATSEKALLQRAAAADGRKFSDWARVRLLACARRELREGDIEAGRVDAESQLEKVDRLRTERKSRDRPPPPVRSKIDPDKIAQAQEWLKKGKR